MTKDIHLIAVIGKSVRYEPDTGLFYFQRREIHDFKSDAEFDHWNSAVAGSRAFTSVNKNGHHCEYLLCRIYAAQRVAWLLHYGEMPDGPVYHANGQKRDNRISNLTLSRECYL